MSRRIRLRIQGLAVLVTLALLLGLAVATYNKVFVEVARVTLETDTIGNQLQTASDVKVRGVIVGDVREIDASADGATIELAIRPEYLEQIPADVTARLLPKTLFGERFVAVMPLYVLGLLSSYFATRLITTQAYGQSAGTYDHYFNLFLPPQDVFWSFLKVLVFAVVIILSHCYYGYRASGGPAGVGLAVGRAVRFSIVAVMVIDLFLSLAIWGSTTTVRIAG